MAAKLILESMVNGSSGQCGGPGISLYVGAEPEKECSGLGGSP